MYNINIGERDRATATFARPDQFDRPVQAHRASAGLGQFKWSAAPTTPGTTAITGTSSSSGNYSATQLGSGCDPNGATWTPKGIDNITCGTTILIGAINSRGYLYLQLPNNAAFAANNAISVQGSNLQFYGGSNCFGLAEQNATTGYLAEYCGSGHWAIYSISNTGAMVRILANSITSTRQAEVISLTFKGSTLTFAIDTEVHTLSISPIQPVKVAIEGYSGTSNATIAIENFSYTIQS